MIMKTLDEIAKVSDFFIEFDIEENRLSFTCDWTCEREITISDLFLGVIRW